MTAVPHCYLNGSTEAELDLVKNAVDHRIRCRLEVFDLNCLFGGGMAFAIRHSRGRDDMIVPEILQPSESCSPQALKPLLELR